MTERRTQWVTLSDKSPVGDIKEFVRANTRDGQEVHVGTDSLQHGRYTDFVTVVVILNPPKGGRVVSQRLIVPRMKSLRERLTREVWLSTELSMTLDQPNLTIHIDANAKEKYPSSKYLQELVGMVVGQGFKALWKPDSWAATHVADHAVRYKHYPRVVQKRRLA